MFHPPSNVFHENSIQSFGRPIANCGWIKCFSDRFAGRPYYYNVRSQSSTWVRPLSKNIPLPIYSQGQKRKLESHLNDVPTVISNSKRKNNDNHEMNIEGKINLNRSMKLKNQVDHENHMDEDYESGISHYSSNSDETICQDNNSSKSVGSSLKYSQVSIQDDGFMRSIDVSQYVEIHYSDVKSTKDAEFREIQNSNEEMQIEN